MITVQLLGGACLRSGEASIAGPPVQRHRIALLTMVVAAWPQPLARDRAMALLWPERDLPSARRLLNLAVHVLRSALGGSAIVSTGDGLRFDPSGLSCDLHALRGAIASGDLDRIISLYTGPLLDGFHLSDSSEFGFWLDGLRHELTHAHIGALLAVADRQERSGDARGRVRTCRRLVAADPYSATHAEMLMRALDASGDWAGACQHATDYAHRLRTDLDLAPGPAIVELAEQLRTTGASRQTLPARKDGTRASSVAVLPFRNVGDDPDTEYFADGITDDVIANLAKIRALTVISRTSVLPFRRREGGLAGIAAKLGVSTVLDGSVRQSGNRVRIVASLVEAESGRQLWAETYDRNLSDIFAIQTDVAVQMAAALEAALTPGELSRMHRNPTRDLDAYRSFLQGRRWLVKYTGESMARAIDYFEDAVARDPQFALAWAALAATHLEFTEGGFSPPETAYPRTADAIARALAIDPELGSAYCSRAHLKMVQSFDWPGAESDFRRALELSPGLADAHNLYARLCGVLGRFDDAIALAERAQELDPEVHKMDVVTVLLRAGRNEEALRRAENAVEVDADSARVRATLGWAYLLSGRADEGIVQLENAVALSPKNSMWLAQLGLAKGMTGNKAAARDILRQLDQRAAAGYVSPYYHAYVLLGLGEIERALQMIEHAVAHRSGPAYGIKGSFLFASLRSHPRFLALLEMMNLR